VGVAERGGGDVDEEEESGEEEGEVVNRLQSGTENAGDVWRLRRRMGAARRRKVWRSILSVVAEMSTGEDR